MKIKAKCTQIQKKAHTPNGAELRIMLLLKSNVKSYMGREMFHWISHSVKGDSYSNFNISEMNRIGA